MTPEDAITQARQDQKIADTPGCLSGHPYCLSQVCGCEGARPNEAFVTMRAKRLLEGDVTAGMRDRERGRVETLMTQTTLYDRVRLAREGAAVERCHCHPHLLSYTVGHHSLDLITLITLSWQADHGGALPSSNLLVAAAFHDVAERITGDVPQPVKVLMGTALADMERRTEAWLLGHNLELTQEEAWYLHAGDRLELWLWCWEEKRRGNAAFLGWVADYNQFFQDNQPPNAYATIILYVMLSGSVERLDFHKDLKGIIG